MRLLLLIIFLIASCTQMKTKTLDESHISLQVKTKLDEARDLMKLEKPKLAMSKLSELNDKNLAPIEKAIKYNLKGVSLFNMGEVDKAILNFEVSEKYSPIGTQLFSQVQLNMASGHFILNHFEELNRCLEKIDLKHLSGPEVKKYAQLALNYGNKTENNEMIVRSSLLLLGDVKTLEEINSSILYEPLKIAFSKINLEDKNKLIEKFSQSQNLAVAKMAILEADERYISGDRSGAQHLISWLDSEFNNNDEVKKFIKDFELRLENANRISTHNIGLVLPLTGEKSSFGQKALTSVSTGLKVLGLSENIKIHTKDSGDSPSQAAQAVLELIRQEKVSFIIGGLFPENAKAEYLEAKKYGVLYISLSQINLPKEKKNHLLIEVQGSIESQIETLLSDEMIEKFGSRLGVIFPENEAGKSYIDEIWRKVTLKNLQMTSVASFPKNTHDYRDTAQLFLGLKYPRERSEELKILDDVYSMEKTSIRRVQTLPPVLDFDWVFLATFPHEASQLISTLGYYDANRIKVIGGPSWVSKSMVKEQKNLGTLYFIGDDPKDFDRQLINKFQEMYGRQAGLIEILAFDAVKLGAEALLASGNVNSRDDFDAKLKAKGSLKGLSTFWQLRDGVWLKRMNAMSITHGEIVKLFGESHPN
jgi:ABC-type branched-subunit amino acid transport system substrate-binding protein